MKFQALQVSSLNRIFLNLGLKSSISRNIRKAFFWENIGFFLILELESSISKNIRNFFWSDIFCFLEGDLGLKVQGFICENIKKAFFWENIRNFLILELEGSISWNKGIFFSGRLFSFFWAQAEKWPR